MAEYRQHSCTLGQAVKVMRANGTLYGVAEDLDALGRLLLRTGDGVLHTIHAGDVSLRNI